MKKMFIVGAAALGLFAACKKTENTPTVTVISGIKTISVPFDPMGTKPFTLFRFSDSSVVANTDSATNKWDFGMRFTNIILNKGFRGPGEAGVILQDGVFDQITAAPSTGYAYDTSATQKAIRSYTAWATYANQVFTPIAGKVFYFRTGDGSHYAKLEMLSVEYAPFVGSQPTTILYKFRYVYQSNGSLNF